MERPRAVAAMVASASGVLKTRSAPTSSCRPSVIRNTPPSLPTSSPKISTRLSLSSASCSARLSALPRVIVSILFVRSLRCKLRHKVRFLLQESRRRIGKYQIEDSGRVRDQLAQESPAHVQRPLFSLLADRLPEGIVERPTG